MSKEYVEQQDGAYRVAGTRVSLDSVVYAFRRGASPESIQRSYPLLTLDEARLGGLEDSEVLAIAADEGRILVTHDRKTMPRH